MKTTVSGFYRNPVKFRMPTPENLVPIRLDIEIEGQRYKDTFTWNPYDPDSEVVAFAKRTVKDLKLPPAFVTQIPQSIQSQLAEFRSYEGQDMYAGEKIVPIKLDLRVNHMLVKDQFLWDLNNFESDPEEFSRIFCKDTGIEDPEVGPAIAFAIREQLYEIAIQSVVSARESRMSKKGRRGAEYTPVSLQNWIEYLYWKQHDINYPGMDDAMVHRGFYTVYHNTTICPAISDVERAKKFYGDTEIIATGHSMGGAMASFCGLDLMIMIILAVLA